MTKYTAADFANARFAEHEASGALATRDSGDSVYGWRTWGQGFASDARMAESGWVPVIPARIIHDRDVEALCADTASYERDDYLDGFIRGFQQAGGVILEDPEPTTTDILAKLLGEVATDAGVNLNPRLFAEQLDNAGVTAPNVKGN